jgi:hypothetical protein
VASTAAAATSGCLGGSSGGECVLTVNNCIKVRS